MKYKYLLIPLSLFFITLTASKCKKDRTPVDPVSQLPPETQTGANTFGCLVDGKVFVPKGSPFSGPILQCAYQYLDNGSSKGFYFQLNASNKSNSSDVTSIGVYTDSLEISKMDFQLVTNEPSVKLSII